MKKLQNFLSLALVIVLASALFIVSCKKDEESTEPQPKVYHDGSGEIDSEGGTIYMNDESSPINGSYIEIPSGAIGSQQTITISEGVNNSDFTGSDDIIVVDFEPDGLEFNQEVEVAIPYPDNFDPDRLTVFYYKEGSDKVDKMPVTEVDKTNKLIKFKTTHFSGYFTSEDGLPCPGTPTMTDQDGNVYNTVNINGQCWMKENLNVGTMVESTPNEWPLGDDNDVIEKFCLNDNPINCQKFGGLYVWNEFMKYNESNPQGICPDGWKIPSDAEWNALIDYCGGWTDSYHLRAESAEWGYHYGDNASGFTALPGGGWETYSYNSDDHWHTSGAYFGLSDPYEFLNVEGINITGWEVFGFTPGGVQNSAVSIRCIKAEGGNFNQAPSVPSLNFPQDQADVSLPFFLQWSSADPDNDPLLYDVYLGTNNNPALLAGDIAENNYEITDLTTGQTYYWKVIVDDGEGHQVESDIYSFNITGSDNLPPTIPSNPSPENGATIEETEINLHWACTDPEQDPITYDVYFGTSSNPPLVAEDFELNTYQIDDLDENTSYYWKIVAKDDHDNTTEGPVWSFTNLANVSPVAYFTASPTSGEAPLTVNFTDQSTNNPTNWLWDFGDGESSTEQNPSHIYNTDGSYTVSLTVSNEYGSDVETINNLIYVGSGGGGEPCPGTPTVTDADGNVYNTVQIGGQCWMKENLKVGTRINGSEEMTDNGTIEKYCYGDDPANCEVYGGLYQWNEMMQYSTTPGVQGICPDGWHLPSDDEWDIVVDYLGGSGVAGGKMKETGTTHWNSPNTGATNESGFTALPGGYRTTSGSFSYLDYIGYWWSSTEYSSSSVWYRSMYYNYDDVGRIGSYKDNGFSVRCLKD